MRKRLLHVLVVLFVAWVGGAYYLASITVPIRLKTLVIDEIEAATGKKAFLQSMGFSLLKGIVLEGPVIYDGTSIMIRAKEISCGLPLVPLIKKKIFIPALKIESPSIYLARGADNSLNLAGLISLEYKSKSGFALTVRRIIIRKGRVDFFDRSLEPVFNKKLEDFNADVRLLLPAKVVFNIAFEIPAASPPVQPITIKSSGEYFVPEKELTAQIFAEGLIPKEFAPYYRNSGLSFPHGTLDAKIGLRVKGGVIDLDLDGRTKTLVLSKDKVEARLDSGIKMLVQYTLKDAQIEYAGKLDIRSMDITGMDMLGPVEKIKAKVEFTDSRAWSEDILVEAFGIPWKAKINLVNYKNPVLDIYADAQTRLGALQQMLKDNFGLKIPTEISGKADIQVAIQMMPDIPMKLNGYVRMNDATINLGSGNFPIECVNGEAHFTLNALDWSGVKARYRDIEYDSSGKLTNFASPGIDLQVSSNDLSFSALCAVSNKRIKLTTLNGRCLNSTFSAAGEISLEDPSVTYTALNGVIDFELSDLKGMYKNSAGIRKMKASGKLAARFALTGDMKNIRACNIEAEVKSGYISAYGIKMTGIVMDYVQEKGVGIIKSMRSSLYGGTMTLAGKVDLLSKGTPYSVNLDARDIKLERFKNDTDFKSADVSGDIRAYANLKGLFKDSSKLTGIGKISLARGKLWQLNLFKGLGALIFTSDFSDILFTEGSCDFKVKDNAFLAGYIVMRSDVLAMYGSGRIGFDRSVNGVLKPELNEEAIGSDTRARIASAIGKGTVIEITGTLKQPQYKVKTSVVDVVGGIASAFFQQE